MKKRLVIAAGGLAVALAAAIPVGGAFGNPTPHCQKYHEANLTANLIVSSTNSGQSSNVSGILIGAFVYSKCA